ncbi:hypothetical protein, partial [Streptomyces sp. NPDC006324]|uniref:hypothetical protein n=1 Tax=Streptomyces sp. NPDC006324 TaxID=3156751 RepID=UPI0033BA2524
MAHGTDNAPARCGGSLPLRPVRDDGARGLTHDAQGTRDAHRTARTALAHPTPGAHRTARTHRAPLAHLRTAALAHRPDTDLLYRA